MVVSTLLTGQDQSIDVHLTPAQEAEGLAYASMMETAIGNAYVRHSHYIRLSVRLVPSVALLSRTPLSPTALQALVRERQLRRPGHPHAAEAARAGPKCGPGLDTALPDKEDGASRRAFPNKFAGGHVNECTCADGQLYAACEGAVVALADKLGAQPFLFGSK